MIIAVGGLIPLGYLIAKAFDVEGTALVENLFRWRNAKLFLNTLLLTVGVLIFDILLATPAAWLTTHSDLRGKRIFSVLCALPLAIPGYVMAYALLALGGNNGIFAALFGKSLPRLSGYWGALIALSFYTSPYLFLNLRTALLGLDPSLEESARSLGYRQWDVFIRVILPQLRPAFYAAGMLICLHVLGDFGVVSLMRYETFSYALYIEYNMAFEHNYAAWLALILLAFTGCLLYLETQLLTKVTLHRAGHGTSRHRTLIPLGRWKSAGYLYLSLLFVATVGIPAATVFLWLFKGFEVSALDGVLESLVGSIGVAVPSALCCAVLAVPFAYIGVRYSSRFSNTLARIPYIIYAIPPLAFALSFIFIVGSTETIFLLICACILHFLAEATGPVRSSLYQASPHLEEAARSLGCSPVQAFLRTLFPLLTRGMLAATVLVFLATMKELPLTLLLRPPEYETLAVNVWDYTGEAMFAQAAPYAFVILIFSALFIGTLIHKE
ncbi:iron ABC transporter permease [Candidatus Poribacteria bacterium]|nr:iron ABC transporter permease [Candidatus Poribacteria bacterium]